jgi:cytochrome b involved in lipid metabolism
MAESETLKEYTADEVFKHTSQEDCWLVIGNESNGAFSLFPA